MQILIPMTGNGLRFVNAGYDILKPFIRVHNQPIIQWVLKIFAGYEEQIKLICREEHLKELPYVSKELESIASKVEIFSIKNWKKQGPVHDLLQAEEIIKSNEPTIVSYCDYYMSWNFQKFLEDIKKNSCDGSLPCYSGFHPHLIPKKNLYASCKVDAQDYLIEIKEKYSWNTDKTEDRHSPGFFYFKTGDILLESCKSLMKSKEDINGEYYLSLAYNHMVQAGQKVWCPNNVEYFCQWGTPEDLQEYEFWNNLGKLQ